MTMIEFKDIKGKIKKLSVFAKKCLNHYYSNSETNLLPLVEKSAALDISSELHAFTCLNRFGYELVQNLGPDHGKIEGYFPSFGSTVISIEEINEAFDKYQSKF